MATDGQLAFVVRPATPADVEQLARLRWRWRVEEEGERGDSVTFASDLAAWLASHEASHSPFLAEGDTGAVGMAWLVRVERIPSPARPKRAAGFLQSVYVVPELRDQGIGALLVDAVIAKAKAEQLEYLVVHPSLRAFSLYRRAGFADAPDLLELRFAEATAET